MKDWIEKHETELTIGGFGAVFSLAIIGLLCMLG